MQSSNVKLPALAKASAGKLGLALAIDNGGAFARIHTR